MEDGEAEVACLWTGAGQVDGVGHQQQVGGAPALVREVLQQGCGLQQVLTPVGGPQVGGVGVVLLPVGVALIDKPMVGTCRIVSPNVFS